MARKKKSREQTLLASNNVIFFLSLQFNALKSFMQNPVLYQWAVRDISCVLALRSFLSLAFNPALSGLYNTRVCQEIPLSGYIAILSV
jgi:hypothetical protein